MSTYYVISLEVTPHVVVDVCAWERVAQYRASHPQYVIAECVPSDRAPVPRDGWHDARRRDEVRSALGTIHRAFVEAGVDVVD
jgi:hypothetical protein